MQLPLPLKWDDTTTFASFYPGDNAQVIAYLKNFVQGLTEPCVYLYGVSGVGLTHLLRACCLVLNREGNATAYLPLAKANFSPTILEGLESLALICLDDIEAVIQDAAWEEALFHCYNRLLSTGCRLLIASHAPPVQHTWGLADLGSRLAASVVFQVKPLADEQKIAALQLRANAWGLGLSLEVGNYLIHHYSRDMHALQAALEKLDQASYIAQRRLTIPFVKTILG
ncbi:MAG TPA: DnaA regulatory inactivator Hda [Gammaproteobacteria bacterium]|nr:DnaA regulatory inactivator Hda [Gammaproteobacteria bacterium]